MNLERAFKAMFDDPKWVTKLLLAFVFEILIVTGPAVGGYWLQYMRNVARGQDTPLPEWDRFGTYWVQGFMVFVAAMVYIVVGLLLLIIGIIPAAILLQAAVVEYAITERVGSLFALGSIWKKVTTYTSFWTAWAVGLGLGVVINVVTGIFRAGSNTSFTALGSLIAVVLGLYTLAVESHMYGQYAATAYGLARTDAIGYPPPQTAYAPPPPAPGGYAPPPPAPVPAYAPPSPPAQPTVPEAPDAEPPAPPSVSGPTPGQ